MPLSELPDPNNFFLGNQFFSLSSVSDGGRNVYTTDNIRAGNKTQNVTIGYVVAMRAANKVKEDQKRICFIYMKSDSPDQWGSQYSWTVDKTACLRNIRSAYIFYCSKLFDNLFLLFRPGFGARQKFNTTILETCGSAQHFIVFWTFLSCFWSHFSTKLRFSL